MFQRKITEEIIKWKNKSGEKKALVVRGMRQVGKTCLVRTFAEENYENVVYVDFQENQSAKTIFEGDLSVDGMTLQLSAFVPSARFEPGKTVILFDTFWEDANTQAVIRAFEADGRYDVICLGNMLEGKEYGNVLSLKPMDFEEFLWAKGVNEFVLEELRDCFLEHRPMSRTIHAMMSRCFREYLCVGGMPQVVDRFLSTKDMNAVLTAQRDILKVCQENFGKRVKKAFDSIPAQLAKENKKFTYSLLEKKGRSEHYRDAVQWLADAGMINLSHNLSTLKMPLEENQIDNVFKAYMQDCGLFVAMLEDGSAGEILDGNLGICSGGLYESIIADAFSKSGRPMYYYRKESGLEIDFITSVDGEVTLVEGRATTGNAKAVNTILKNKEQYGVSQCIKLSENNLGQDGEKLLLPYYMLHLLHLL